ncbi:PapD-like protein [Lipomyces oligophaga]|uniref:PapD-like protein n=1 Tax=Lipomyces oligophaga TaxID=45792 RepID=UPI0034CD0EBB
MEIYPAVLEFSGPFSQPITRHLQLHNKSAEPLAYKVKTTAPKLYSVKPNASRVNPGERIDVKIVLQLMYEPQPGYECKDKFLIESIPIPPEMESVSVLELWKTSASEKSTSVRVKVHYDTVQPVSTDAEPASPIVPTPVTPSLPSVQNTPTSGFTTSTDSEVIAGLKSRIRDLESELKSSKEPNTTSSTSPVARTSTGVPVATAALLCLIAFLLAWLFF